MLCWYGRHGGGWAWLAMSISIFLFLALLFVIALLIVRALGHSAPARGEPPAHRGGPNAEQILAERYARGEIDEEEYRRRLATLRGAPPGGAPPGGEPPGGASP
ncbi:SHOCT domain-containing protein [Streptomyces platensis]|uniref:SHOCT domain-containing protein n=1 Tax=Streptomyces platensis TaxID=58346 RepID=UPI003690600D